MKTVGSLRTGLLAVSSAALASASFPPWDLSVVAWVALVPLLLAVQTGSLRRAFVVCGIFGYVHAALLFHWIFQQPAIPVPASLLIGLYLALFHGLFGIACRVVSGHLAVPLVIAAPVSWVALEFLRSRAGFLAFPLNLLGHSQHARLDIIKVASIGGVYLVSFLIVFVNAALLVAMSFLVGRGAGRMAGISPRAAAGSAFAALAAVLAVVLHGQRGSVATDPVSQPAITVIQGNIPQNTLWSKEHRRGNLDRYIRLTEGAAASKPSLVVWPESAIPGPLSTDLRLFVPMYRLARSIAVPILAGATAIRKSPPEDIGSAPGLHNSAYLLSREGRIVGRYDKVRLLPFREYLPARDDFPWPENIRRAVMLGVPGRNVTLFDGDGFRFGVAICWDSLFPEDFRRFVGAGADLMVNISNEAVFGETAASHQLLAMTVFRAVENRIAIVRAANSGVSCFIGPRGEIVSRVRQGGKDIFVDGTLTERVPIRRTSTFYTRHGDLFSGGCAIVTVALLLAGVGKELRGRAAKRFVRRWPPT